MFKENLYSLRKLHHLTQEELAEKLEVSRQTIAKWESGDTVPDLEKSQLIAELFDVSLDDLANYKKDNRFGLPPAPKGKYLFGLAIVDSKGKITIPSKARKVFSINPGDELVVLGDEASGIALIKAQDFLKIAEMISNIQN